jgi:hypothetical protein
MPLVQALNSDLYASRWGDLSGKRKLKLNVMNRRRRKGTVRLDSSIILTCIIAMTTPDST